MELTTSIEDNGSTNIYHAVKEALNMIDSRDDKQRNAAVLLFTDGVPNVSPPRGEQDSIKKILNTKGLSCPIHTFGFGYGIKSDLLYDIAKLSNGMNGFIPDASFVGTIFVNAISNILTTAAVNVKFNLNLPKQSQIGDMFIGDFDHKRENDSFTINIGLVRYG